eukprot:gene6801-7906_t
MNKAIAGLVEDFSLVSFKLLNIMEKESVSDLLKAIDKSNGFVYNSLNTDNATILDLSEREMKWDFERTQEVQERYYDEHEFD